MYLNKVTIIGNLTKDVEIKSLPSGIKVANLSVATNRTYKDKDNAKQEQVEYHSVIAFGKQAEVVSTYFTKGSQILVEGRLQTRSWEDKDGKKAYKTEIILENFQFGNTNKSVEKETKKDTTTSEGRDGEVIDMSEIPF